jgi:S-ribosylhomocysteine lyase
MEKIASFNINHNTLLPGVYVSRVDDVKGNAITTFDLRFTKPNIEPAMETAPIHAIEHLAATFLRNDEEWSDKIIYFGPMGCRTGFYLIIAGDLKSEDIVELLKRTFKLLINFEGEIPGASKRDCGNYLDTNLTIAKVHSRKYYDMLENITEERTVYSDE